MADCETDNAAIRVKTPEESEEAKLKAKYPSLNKSGVSSVILQKRLNKGHKYFDSGDYNMAKAKVLQQQKKFPLPPPREDASLLQCSTGETIPTPENVTAVRRKSLLITEAGLGHQCLLPGASSPPHPSPPPGSQQTSCFGHTTTPKEEDEAGVESSQ